MSINMILEFMLFLMVLTVIGIVVYVVMKEYKNMGAGRNSTNRRTNFMENAEEFTLAPVNPEWVTNAVKQMDYAGMQTKMQGSSTQQMFKFTGNGWAAQLRRISGDAYRVTYRFEFTNWKMLNGMPQDGQNMNKLLMAVEKIFFTFDPNAQVRTVPPEFNAGRNIM